MIFVHSSNIIYPRIEAEKMTSLTSLHAAGGREKTNEMVERIKERARGKR